MSTPAALPGRPGNWRRFSPCAVASHKLWTPVVLANGNPKWNREHGWSGGRPNIQRQGAQARLQGQIRPYAPALRTRHRVGRRMHRKDDVGAAPRPLITATSRSFAQARAQSRQPAVRLNRYLVKNDGEECQSEFHQKKHASVLHTIESRLSNTRWWPVRKSQLGRRVQAPVASAGERAVDNREIPFERDWLKMGGRLFRQADIAGARAHGCGSVRGVVIPDGMAITRPPAAAAVAA